MSARLQLFARAAAARLLSPIGTPPVSLALAALALAYHLAAIALGRAAGADAAARLATSVAFEVLAAALVVDACVAALRALPITLGDDGRVVVGWRGRRRMGAGVLRLAYLVLALAFAASLLSRDVLVLRVAEGEEFTGADGQYSGREPPRPLSPGPFPLRFEVVRVEGAADAAGAPRAERVELLVDGAPRTLSGLRPLWFGWGRFLALSSYGLVPRYELRGARGAALESAFVKLDVLPPGRVDAFRVDAAPFRVVVGVAPERAPGAGGELARPVLVAHAYRGRMDAGEARLGQGGTLPLEGLTLAFPEVRRWAELRMIRDPGIPLAALAAALALAGLALRALPSRARGAR